MRKLMVSRPLMAPAERVSVSIVVPCYNYGCFLPQCVGSLLGQQAVDVHILIIDDASPDGSGEVAEALAATDSRISTIRHKRNHGHIATFNEGLGLVDSKYVVLLSADDLLPPGALARAVALLEVNPSVGLVYGHPVNFSGSSVPPARNSVYGWSIWPGECWIRAQCRRGLNCIYSPEVVMRTAVQKSVGGFDPNLPHSGDLELWLRIAAISNIGRVNGTDQAYRRIHDTSMMRSSFADVLTDLKERRKAYETFFATNGCAFRGADRSLMIVRRRLAGEALEYACHLLESREVSVSSAADYVSFARESYTGYTSLPAWREYTLFSKQESFNGAVKLRRRSYALRRDLEGRMRFKRWQWTGV